MGKLIEVFRPAWILGALTLMFWAILDAATGGLSQLTELKITANWIVKYPFVISRYVDALLVFICAAGLVITSKLFKALGSEDAFRWELYFFEVVTLLCGVVLTVPLLIAPSQSIASVSLLLFIILPILWLLPLIKPFSEWAQKLSYAYVVCFDSTLILAILFTWVRGIWVGLATLLIGFVLTLPYLIITGVIFLRFMRSQR